MSKKPKLLYKRWYQPPAVAYEPPIEKPSKPPALPWPFNLVGDLISWFKDAIDNLPTSTSQEVWNYTPLTWAKTFDALNSMIESFTVNTYTFLQDPIGQISTLFDGAVSTLWSNMAHPETGLRSIYEPLFSDVSKSITGLGEKFTGLAWEPPDKIEDPIRAAIIGAFQWLIENITEVGGRVAGTLSSAVLPTIIDGLKFLSDFFSGLFINSVTQILYLINPQAKRVPEETLDLMLRIPSTLFGIFMPLAIAAIAGELVHPLKQMGLPQLSAMAFEMAGFRRIIDDIMSAIVYVSTVLPLRYALMAVYTPRLPREEEILMFTQKGVLDYDKFKIVMHKLGYADDWVDLYWKTHWFKPRFDDLRELLRRGAINEDQFRDALRYNAIPDEYIEAYRQIVPTLPTESNLKTYFLRGYIDETTAKDYLKKHGYTDDHIKWEMDSWWIIPGVRDLITFVVREVIKPEDFYDWSKKQGLSEYWAKNYWEAHWVLPSFENLREAFWRGIISEEEFRKYIVWHDYKPEPRPGISKSDQEIMRELSYVLPGRIDLRWMWRWGVIDYDEYKDILRMLGVHPDWIERVALAETRNALEAERTGYASALERAYLVGAISESTLRARLRDLYFTPEEVEMRINRANLLKRIAQREPEVEESGKILADEKRRLALLLEKLAYSGIIDETTFLAKLKNLGFTQEEIALRLEIVRQYRKYLESKVKPDEPHRITKSELSTLWRYRLINDSEYLNGLVSIGYTRDDAYMMLQSEYAKMVSDETTRLRTTVENMYKKGLMSEDELRAWLTQLGYHKTEIELLIMRANMERAIEITELEEDIYLEAFEKGKIDKTELIQALVEIGYSQDVAELKATLKELQLMPKPKTPRQAGLA